MFLFYIFHHKLNECSSVPNLIVFIFLEFITGFFWLVDLGVTFLWTPCPAGRFSNWKGKFLGWGGLGG